MHSPAAGDRPLREALARYGTARAHSGPRPIAGPTASPAQLAARQSVFCNVPNAAAVVLLAGLCQCPLRRPDQCSAPRDR